MRDKVVAALGIVQPLLKSFHRHTDEIIDRYSTLVGEGLSQVLSADTIDQAINAAYGQPHETAQELPSPSETQPSSAQKGALDSVRLVLQSAQRQVGKLRDALRGLYTEAAEQGATEAADAAGGTPSSLDILASEEQWVNEVVDTLIDRVTDVIARSFTAGLPMEETLAEVKTITMDPRRAWLITETEYARAMTLAARQTYEANNVPEVMWMAEADCCARCQANVDVSPIPLSTAWPSGDVPVHPRCRCAEAPAVKVPQAPLLP